MGYIVTRGKLESIVSNHPLFQESPKSCTWLRVGFLIFFLNWLIQAVIYIFIKDNVIIEFFEPILSFIANYAMVLSLIFLFLGILGLSSQKKEIISLVNASQTIIIVFTLFSIVPFTFVNIAIFQGDLDHSDLRIVIQSVLIFGIIILAIFQYLEFRFGQHHKTRILFAELMAISALLFRVLSTVFSSPDYLSDTLKTVSSISAMIMIVGIIIFLYQIIESTYDDLLKDRDISLDESKERYTVLFNTATEAIYMHTITDKGPGLFLEVNDAACKLLGYSREELLTMSPRDIGHPSSRQGIGKTAKKLISKGKLSFEALHVTKEGKQIPVEVSSVVWSKSPPLVFSIARDISFRKEAEKAKIELEIKREKFISMTNHELRTPLAIIQGYVEFIQHNHTNIDAETINDNLNIIIKNVDRLKRLIQGVSDIEKIEKGLLEINRVNIPICDAMGEVVDSYKKMLGDQFKSERLSPRQTVIVNIDPERLVQVLDILMDNAISQTDKKDRQILLICEVDEKKFTIKLEDNGVGIKEENLKKIFDEFVTISTSSSVRGTGIGLFLAKTYIERQDGTIIALSEGEGKGSTFQISLPIVKIEE